MVIADRGFGDLWTLASNKFYGKISTSMFKYGSLGWQVKNGFDYLKKTDKSCYKVLLCDKNDDIVDVHSSLMINVAKEICTKQLMEREKELNDPIKMHAQEQSLWSAKQ
jgi:hypothetical protein